MKNMILLLMLAASSILQAQTWTNPLTLNGEWPSYGIGDPYIMKYRGLYYLYCSTKDNNTGVKCWSTKDFITWSGPYNCTSEAVTKTAYAPEVVYWNGTFYMYTSPGGNGHYILTANTPTGPFTLATANLGKSIDGSIFIEDNGAWYFYHAADAGIQGCPMSSPTDIGADVNLNARVGSGWTEGPTVIKRDGIYYLIYTGNHVISKGYRIDYAQNTAGPINAYTPQTTQNPILIKTEGAFVGLGHGSAFIGPDLDTYYYTYHNLESRNGPLRHLNFDRIAWNGTKLLLLGPTNWAQQPFRQADMSDFFNRNLPGENWLFPNGGNWTIKETDRLAQELSSNDDETLYKALCKQSTEADYIAEFTVKQVHSDSEDARFGAVFDYTGEENYGIAVLNSHTNRLEINFKTENNWETPRHYNLPAAYNLGVWHNLRIEKSGTTRKFFVDGLQKAVINNPLNSGKIGYITSRCQADFGYIAFSNKVNGSGIFDIYKPVPGIIAAVHYNTGGEGTAYHDLTPGNTSGLYIRNDDVDITNISAEGGYAINADQDEWHKYNINVKTAGPYHLALRYSATEDSRIRIWKEDTDLTGPVDLPATGTRGTNLHTITIKGLTFSAGHQTLKIETIDGNFIFYEMRFEQADNTILTQSDTFDGTTFSSAWNYTDGTWEILSGEAGITGHGKRTLGNTGWTDYSVQVDVTYYDNFNAGLIFRVNNPALGGAGSDPAAGTDFLQGYYVSLSANSVILGKQNYNWTQLATKSGTYAANTKYTLKVEVQAGNIKVYVDNMETPQITYTDTQPFICGKVGLRVCNAHVRFDNFSVTTREDEKPVNIDIPDRPDAVGIYPNPVSDKLTVQNTDIFSRLSIYKADGQEIYRKNISGANCIISTSVFNKGLYILKLTGNGNCITRKFIKI
jgi:hypothetical protein